MSKFSRLWRQHPVVMLALGLVLCASVVFLRAAWRMQPVVDYLHPQRTPVTAADRVLAEQRMGPFEDVRLTTSDGLTLRGWYKPSRNGAAVIFVHGGNENRNWFVPEAAALAQAGFGVLLYDSRACGESDGQLQSWGDHEQLDVRAATDFLVARPDVRGGRIGIYGFSIGSATVALSAAQDPRLQAVVLSAMWPSLNEELRHKAAFPKFMSEPWVRWRFESSGTRIARIRPAAALPAIAPRPLLLIAGETDVDTPLEIMRGNIAASGGRAEFWVIPRAGHERYEPYGGEKHLQRLSGFYANALLAPR